MYTDREFRHYQELYNPDPVVQRLCQMRFYEDDAEELENQVAELEDEVGLLQSVNEDLECQVHDLEDEVRVLKEKIAVWTTMESQ